VNKMSIVIKADTTELRKELQEIMEFLYTPEELAKH